MLKDRTLQTLVADLVAARAAAGMTQRKVAVRTWTTKSAVSRLESGCHARPTLDTIEKHALAVGARVEFRAVIRDDWIERAISDPVRQVVQADGRIRR